MSYLYRQQTDEKLSEVDECELKKLKRLSSGPRQVKMRIRARAKLYKFISSYACAVVDVIFSPLVYSFCKRTAKPLTIVRGYLGWLVHCRPFYESKTFPHRELKLLLEFSIALLQGRTFLTSYLHSYTSNTTPHQPTPPITPAEEVSILKRKKFAPRRSKFFSYRIVHFSEGRQILFCQCCLPWLCITQTRLLKYIENFTTKNWKFPNKKFW